MGGLSMYEQEWMVTEYEEVEELQKNISMGDLWLHGMAEGAAKSGRTVQYCMPTPYEVLSAASLPSVTNARATGDYFHSNNQWAVGNTALFYWALISCLSRTDSTPVRTSRWEVKPRVLRQIQTGRH